MSSRPSDCPFAEGSVWRSIIPTKQNVQVSVRVTHRQQEQTSVSVHRDLRLVPDQLGN